MSTYPKRLETLLAERQAQLSAFYRTDEKIRQNLVMAKARIAAQSKRLARATKRLGRDISVLLGVKKEHVDEHAQHCLALAKSGRTIELFKENR